MTQIHGKVISFLGNFEGASYTSENHHAKSLEALGHKVIRFQEGKDRTDRILQTPCDMFVWVHTHLWKTPGMPMKEVLRVLKERRIPTITFHLDKWLGLKREVDMKRDDYWDIAYFFTVDKAMADLLNSTTETKGIYIPAGVYHEEVYLAETLKDGEIL